MSNHFERVKSYEIIQYSYKNQHILESLSANVINSSLSAFKLSGIEFKTFFLSV